MQCRSSGTKEVKNVFTLELKGISSSDLIFHTDVIVWTTLASDFHDKRHQWNCVYITFKLLPLVEELKFHLNLI